MAPLEVDDRQPRLQHREWAGPVDSQIVGPAMRERGGHAPQRALVGAAVSREDACDAAHGELSS